jgi:hypothetical protein
MKKIIIDVLNDIRTEDGGTAKVTSIVGDDSDNGIFVRIISIDDTKDHKEFEHYIGKKVKVTIETID